MVVVMDLFAPIETLGNPLKPYWCPSWQTSSYRTVTKPLLFESTLMVLCQVFDVYALPLLSTIVQGVSDTSDVKVTKLPGGRGAAARGTTFFIDA